MIPRRLLAAATAVLVLGAVPATAMPAAPRHVEDRVAPSVQPLHHGNETRALDAATQVSSRVRGKVDEGITGVDGLRYDHAPVVVPGRDGQLFFGPDFDIACAVGQRFARAMRTYAKVAHIIEKSGRRVIFTAAPDKSMVRPEDVDHASLPHGECDARGLVEQRKILQSHRDPLYLPMLRPLLKSRHQTYWKTDPHWTSVGGAVYAKAIADALDPRLAKRQRYKYGTEVALGMLNENRGVLTPETIETAFPKTKVHVRTGKGCPDWAGYPTLIFDTCWNASPAKLTWPGKTLVLGDSFTMYALENIRPLFQHGNWMWLGHSDDSVAQAVKDSDTVVIEVLQLFVPGTVIAKKSLRTALRKALF